jgi:hypothetical protein
MVEEEVERGGDARVSATRCLQDASDLRDEYGENLRGWSPF